MTSLDPSHLPTKHDHPSRGQAVYRRLGTTGRLGLVPDLRFEQSYLRSLKRYIHPSEEQLDTHSGKRDNIDTAGKASGTEAVALYGVPLRMDWGWIFYVTARDQILSPFAQGAILAVASLYLRPLLRIVGARVRQHVSRTWQSIFPPLEPHIHGGTGWVRKQLREFTVDGIGTNVALAK